MSDATDRAAEVLIAHTRTTIVRCHCGWADLGKSHAEHVARALADAGLLASPEHDAAVVGPYRDLLREFVDDDPCEFDHHGGCQTHGFYEPSPGERCPNALAKELLEDAPPTGRTDPMDPVKALQDLDEHLRQHKRQWEDDEALTDDYWAGYENARRIVGDHLAASRQRRGW